MSKKPRTIKIKDCEIRNWGQCADQTYLSSRVLFTTNHPFLWFDAAYLLHQAIEKYIKMFLCLENEGTIETTHDLVYLFSQTNKLYPNIKTPKIITIMDKNQAFRYPDIPFKGEGLGADEFHAGDMVVKNIRQRIPLIYLGGALEKMLSFDHSNIIKTALLSNNAEIYYWEAMLLFYTVKKHHSSRVKEIELIQDEICKEFSIGNVCNGIWISRALERLSHLLGRSLSDLRIMYYGKKPRTNPRGTKK